MSQIAKSEFKQTELGELSVDWEIKSIKDVGTVVTGRTPSTKIKEYYGSDHMFIAPADLDQGKYVKQSKKLLSKKGLDVSRPLPKNTILVGCIGTIGKTAMTSEENCTTNQQINAIITNEDVCADYVYYVMVYFGPNLSSLSGKVTIPIVNKSNFEQFKIPCPPSPEQQRIAYILSTIQEDKEMTENIINSYKELKKSLMKHLFKYGPVKFEDVDKVKLKETEIGEIPENWDIKSIGEIVRERVRDGVHKTPTYIKTGIPFVTAKDIIDNKINFKDCKYISREEHERLIRAIKPEKGDLLLTKVGTVGNVALIDFDDEFSIFVQLALIKPDTGMVDANFLKQAILSNSVQKEISDKSAQSTMKFIGVQRISTVLVPLPSSPIQQEIAEILSAVDSKIEQEENKNRALKELFKSMLHNLMTAKIRVKDIEVLKWKN